MTRIKVTAPQQGFTGEVAGIAFVKGVATVDTVEQLSAVHYFKRHGYDVPDYAAKASAGRSAAKAKAADAVSVEDANKAPAEPAKATDAEDAKGAKADEPKGAA
jgi:hypothetical protein